MVDVPLLEVDELVITFAAKHGDIRAVDGLSYVVHSGEVLGLVGESGSGKSAAAMAVLDLVPKPGRIASGSIRFDGRSIQELSARELRRLRGGDIAIVFQDASTALNPVMTVGRQVVEALTLHQPRLSRAEKRARAVELLDRVGIPDARRRFNNVPHELSGGMRQRVMIACAIANVPRLIVADEPTTALDVTIQAQILDLLRDAQRETKAATVFISHDLAVVGELADRVCVMYAGRVVEQGPTREVFTDPRHPYTIGLLASRPSEAHHAGGLRPIPGQPPDPSVQSSGCPFEPRCFLGKGRERCRTVRPPLENVSVEHVTACHYHADLDGAALPHQVGVGET